VYVQNSFTLPNFMFWSPINLTWHIASWSLFNKGRAFTGLHLKHLFQNKTEILKHFEYSQNYELWIKGS